MADVPVTESTEASESELIARMTNSVDPGDKLRVPDKQEPEVPEAVPDVQAGEDQVSDEEGEDSTPAEPVVELEHLGKRYVVPESLKTAFEANRAQANRVPAEVVEMRKMLHVERQVIEAQRAFQQHAKPEFDELTRLEAQIEQFKSVDWQTLDTDQLVRARQALDTLKDKRDEAKKTIESKEQQFKDWTAQAKRQMGQHGQEYLRKAIPNWDGTQASEVARYAQSEGFTPEELEEMYDPRAVKVLWKAAQYDKLQSSKPQVANRVREAPPVLKPGASDSSKSMSVNKDKILRERVRKSGSLEDAAAWLLNRTRQR